MNKNFDVTKTNVAVDRMLETTENPRHRFLLQAYGRHRLLEIAGRYEEIFDARMMVEKPVYHFRAMRMNTTLQSQEQVKALYKEWAQVDMTIFYGENELVAVGDNMVASRATVYQQTAGKVLAKAGVKDADPNAMYLYQALMETIWTYDDRGRLAGEDVWDVEPEQAKLIKLAPDEILTTKEAARLLAPHIKPLPDFDAEVLGAQQPAAPH